MSAMYNNVICYKVVGVQQGNNMAHLFFLFPMQAFGEILEKKWIDEWGVKSPEYKYFQKKKTERGRLLGQAMKSAGSTSFNLFYQLYVDNGGFLFKKNGHNQRSRTDS